MGTIGTFGSFTQARLAIYASQMGLSVTGNNISNINNAGYTRQKLDQESFRTGGADRYHSSYSIRVGNGVLTTGVSQLRDPYLDIRYRSEMSSVGAMDAKLGGLESIQAILDEVGDGDDAFGIIEAQISDLYNALQQINDQTGHAEYDIQVRGSAETLTKQLNSYAAKLEEVYNNAEKAFHQDVDTVNGILTSIRDLNAAIRKNEIHGDNALELKDQRNVLIDQLSEYMKIDVIYTQEDIGAGQMVEKLTIRLANANPQDTATEDSELVNGVYATQLSVDGPNFDITLSPLTHSNGNILAGSVEKKLDDNDLYGALQSERELLTECGEFATDDTVNNVDENAATKRGIPYYQKSLDLLANQLAKAFNDANQGFVYNEKGQYISGNYDEKTGIFSNVAPITLTYTEGTETVDLPITRDMTFETLPQAAQVAIRTALGKADGDKISIEDYVKFRGGVEMGKPLFSNRGDNNETEGITAANISISDAWSDGPQIIRSFKLPTGMTSIPSTDGENIVANMVTLFSEKRDFVPGDVSTGSSNEAMFNGTFQEMWVNIGAVLGNDMKVTTTMLDTYHASSVDLDTSRMGMSSVDLNDEAMNLMQYSQSYNAACRLMTTIDSVLDKLINGTGTTL